MELKERRVLAGPKSSYKFSFVPEDEVMKQYVFCDECKEFVHLFDILRGSGPVACNHTELKQAVCFHADIDFSDYK